jgi:ABC-type transporter MlaC component
MPIGKIVLQYVAVGVPEDTSEQELQEIVDEISTYLFLEYKAMLKEYEDQMGGF